MFNCKMCCRSLILLLLIIKSVFASEVNLTTKESIFLQAHPSILISSEANWQPFIVKTADHVVSGFDYDLIALINNKTGANFQLMADKWPISVLSKQKITKPANNISEMQDGKLSFSDSYFSFSKTLLVANDNPKNINSINDLLGKRVGYLASDLFEQQVLFRYHDLDRVPIASLPELIDALKRGDIDAIIASNNIYYLTADGPLYLKTVGIFPDSRVDLKFSIRQDHPEALAILNKGLSAISNEQKLQLLHKWFLNFDQENKTVLNDNLSFNLNFEEKQYLANKGQLTVGALDSFVPFSFTENGQQRGYSVEYMRLLAHKIGINIKFITKPWPELLKMLKDQQLDIIPHVAVTPEREKYIDYTNFTHVSFLTGFLLHKNESINSLDDLNGKTLAVVDQNFVYEYLKENYPEIKLLVKKSTEELIDAVIQNRAFAAVDSIPTLNYFIQKNWLSNLTITTLQGVGLGENTDLPMAVHKGNYLLKSILEKAHDSLSLDLASKLKQKWLYQNNFVQDDLKLNQKERAFISNHPQIRFRIRPNRAPFEFVQDGKVVGLAVDYIKAIADYAGFKAEFVVNDMPVKDAYQMVEGERTLFDTVIFSVKSSERAQRFAFGDNFLSYPMMVIGHQNAPPIVKTSDLKGKTVVAERGFLTEKWLKRDYPGINIKLTA